MPFLEDNGQPIDLSKRIDTPTGFAVTPGANDLEDTGERPSWNFAADLRRSNIFGAKLASNSEWTDNQPEAGFNPWDKIKGTPDEVNFKALSEARNTRKFDAIKRDVARENEDRKLVDSQPWYVSLVTGGVATLLDPTTFLPGGAFVKGAKGGIAVAGAAARVGSAAAVGTAVQESILQSTEQTRTAGESATAIGASLFLGGLLGAGGQAVLSKMEWQKGVANLDHDLAGVRVPSDAKPVFDDVFSQLKATGMADEEARVNASVFAARYATRAERLGEGATPLDVYRGDGLEIRRGENGTAEGVGVFNQSAEVVAREKATLDKMMEDLRTDKSVADAAFEQMSKLSGAKDDWAKVLGSEPGGIELASSNSRNKLTAAVTRSQENPNGWRVTYFDERGFSGHTEYKTKEQAASAALDEGYTVPANGSLRKAMESGTFFQAAEKAEPQGKITVYKDNSAVIDLFKGANKSTFMHEAGHLWLNEMVRDASKSAGIKSDLDQITKWLGVSDASKIELKHHEQWARGFEEYLRDGKAPSTALANAFESFKKWLTEIYKSLTNLGPDHVKINDDIRGVMDRMLATDREIAVRDAGEITGGAKSVGAAANSATELADNTIAGAAARGVAASTAKLNPLLRALHSPSAAHREIMLDLVENPLYLQKNFERVITNEEGAEVGRTANVASSVGAETFMKAYRGGLTKAIEIGNEALIEHRKAGGLMDAGEFNEAVGKAMRRNDTDPDPAVQKAAQEYRARVIDPLFKAAKEVGILPPDVAQTTAPSYFSRLWNSKKISADEQGFKGMVSDWVAQNAPKWAEQFDKGSERRLEPIRRELSDLEMGKLRRAEELKQRLDVADTSEMTEGDIRQALRIVQGGAPKPKGVDTLSQFVLKQGGLVDDASELAHRGITNKARPGLVRKERRTAMNANGGWTLDDMARHAWENGYFPESSQRPSIDHFVEALNDDFHKIRAVLKHGDEDAFKLTELVAQLEADLARAGVGADGKAPRFSTSEEMKGAVERVYKAMDAEADRKAAILKDKLTEREADIRADRESRFVGDPQELGRGIADEVFNTLTGRNGGGVRNDFITIKARGPMKERTFDIEDLFRSANGRGVEDYLEHNVEEVARRYTRVMGADVEIARKYGSVDMLDQFNKIKEDYANLRAEVSAKANLTDPKARLSPAEVEKQLLALKKREDSDVGDLEAMRDTLRDNLSQGPQWSQSYSKAVRMVNNFNYLRSMGEVAVASLSETVRPAMVHGLLPYMETLGQTLTNLKGIRLSVQEAQLAGNVTECILQTRLATLSEVTDPHAARGPMEAFLANMTNFASKWNGIALLTDMQKSIAAVLTQNRILRGVEMYGKVAEKERAYLAYLGIDQSMAERIAKQFAEHGETVEKVRVANQEKWTDQVALRHYQAAMNKDVDSIITTKGVADTPLFANSPTGRAVLQFKSFALASHQRVLLRGLQEGPARFVGGMVAMSTIGIMATWLKAISGNRTEKLQDIGENPGWWISEGLDRAGVFAVPMELSNMAEKATGLNPIKAPLKIFDKGAAGSQKNQNRNLAGAILGPTFGTIGDVGTVGFLGSKFAKGDDITQADKNAAERLLPFNSYIGMRQMLRYVVNPQQQ